jgi:hypothetical protein
VKGEKAMGGHPVRGRREAGIAVFVVILVAALMSALAVAALSRSGAEMASSGATRATTRALYAADSGIQIASARLSRADTTPIDITLPNGWLLQSRRRSETAPQTLSRSGNAGAPPEGYALGGYSSEFYVVNITAVALGGGTSVLEAKFGRLSSSTGGY